MVLPMPRKSPAMPLEDRRSTVAGHRVNVPYAGCVDVIMDFTDPVITGMSVSTAISSITKTRG